MQENYENLFADGKIYQQIYSMENWTMLANFMLVAGMTLILLMIAFLFKWRKQLSQRLLIIFFASCFFFLLYYYGFLYRSPVLGSIAVLFGNGMGYLLGPVLFYYIKSLSLSREQIIKPLLKQLIPYGIYWMFISVPLAISIYSRTAFSEFGTWFAKYADYLNLVENVFILTYCVLSIRLINRLKIVYRQSFSNLDKKDLKWCEHLIWGLTAILILDNLLSVYELNYPPFAWNIGMITAFSFVLLFTWLGYKGILQSQILVPEFLLAAEFKEAGKNPQIQPPESDEDEECTGPLSPQPGQLANMSPEEISSLIERLYQILEEDKPYLDDSLTLGDLAQQIGISDKKLSELLNQHIRISFYELINNYRVDTVKKKIHSSESDHYTLLALAFESGFKSKTSFNRVFKLKTGLSPSHYKRNLKKEKEVA